MKANICGGWLVAFLLVVPATGSASGNLQLIDSIKNSDRNAVQLLLQNKSVDVNTAKADGTTALHWAAHLDDLEIAEMLIQAGANPGPANAYGVTPLYLACTNRNHAMVEKILRAGADPNAALLTGETALMNCARTGATEAVAELLSAEANPNARESNQGQTALMWAAGMGYPEVVRLLIDNGAEVAGTTIATVDRLPNTCRICSWKPSSGGFTPLLFAARSGDLASARLLLEAGANPNDSTAQHGNSLVIASAGGHEELALYLLKMGADPNAADENGVTALHYSFRYALSRMHGITYDPVYRIRPDNMSRLAKALIQAGAKTNVQISSSYSLGPAIRDKCESISGMQGATPFMLAAISADIPLMRLLKESGADPHIASTDTTTPLMAAVQAACTIPSQRGIATNEEEVNMSLQAVKLLIDMGINVNALNSGGETAMHMAAFAGAEPVVQLLATHGAQVNVKNKNGETPWSMASGISSSIGDRGSYGNHESTAALLLQLGATPVSREEMKVSDAYSNFSDKAISIDTSD